MSNETKTKAVATVPNYKEAYPVLFSQVDIGEAMRENFEGQEITPRELFFQVKMPAGGGTSFTTIDEEGNEVEVKEITGIILHIGNTRAYHVGKYGTPGADKVPVCSSEDAITGVGSPGGECAKCPMNEFKSAENGKAKACSEYKPLYVLVPKIERPIAIRISSASFKKFKEYNTNLSMSGIKRYQVETVFSLIKVKGDSDYAEIVLKKGNKITDPVALELISVYRKNIIPFLEPQKPEQRPYVAPTDEQTSDIQPEPEPMSGGFIHDVDAIEAEMSKAS